MKRGRTLRRIALVLAALLVLQLGATGAVYRAIFSRWEGSGALPGAETHSFWVGDNRLQGYYLPASDARGLVVVCPGFHSTAAAYGPQLEWLRQRGWSVFTYDPTGCGRSQCRTACIGKQIQNLYLTVCMFDLFAKPVPVHCLFRKQPGMLKLKRL